MVVTVGTVKFDWRYFGAELKFHREAAGLSQQQLGEKVHCSGTYIGQFENATRRPQLPLAVLFDQVLGTNGLFARMCAKLLEETPYDDYFKAVAELEATAETICEYSPLLVPGLLQTPEYAETIIRAAQPLLRDEAVAELVAARMARTKILTDPNRETLFWAILDEAVLRRPIGGPAVMSRELHHVAHFAEQRRVIVQVIPFAAGAHTLPEGMIQIMTFSDAPPAAYVEGPFAGQLLEDPKTIAKCRMGYDLLRAAALSPEASHEVIKSAAEDYAHEH